MAKTFSSWEGGPLAAIRDPGGEPTQKTPDQRARNSQKPRFYANSSRELSRARILNGRAATKPPNPSLKPKTETRGNACLEGFYGRARLELRPAKLRAGFARTISQTSPTPASPAFLRSHIAPRIPAIHHPHVAPERAGVPVGRDGAEGLVSGVSAMWSCQ